MVRLLHGMGAGASTQSLMLSFTRYFDGQDTILAETPRCRSRLSIASLGVRLRASNQPDAAPIGEIGPGPIEHHGEAVAGANQECNMDYAPQPPGWHAP